MGLRQSAQARQRPRALHRSQSPPVGYEGSQVLHDLAAVDQRNRDQEPTRPSKPPGAILDVHNQAPSS